MTVLAFRSATGVTDAVSAVQEPPTPQPKEPLVLTDRCAARRPGWLCVVGCAVSDFSQPHCAAGHYMVRYTAPSAFEGGAR